MSLHVILGYRRHLEEQARVEMDGIARACNAQMALVQHMESELEKLLDEITQRRQQGVTAADGLALYRFAQALADDLMEQRRKADALHARREQQETILSSAARDRRLAERLAARRERERLRQHERREQQAIDAVGLDRWRDAAGQVMRHE